MTGAKDLDLQIRDDVAVVRLTRPHKRNALSDGLIFALRDTFQNLPGTVRAAVLDGEGEHFCAGLDLSELKERDAGQGLHHSRSWHVALEALQYGPVPVVAALHGAVVGGGLELASACHVRVADSTTFYALPEGSRGIFVGGGGSVRIPLLIGVRGSAYYALPEGQRGIYVGGGASVRLPRIIGVDRMMDMMLTGRVYNAADGERLGFAQYLVDEGTAFDKALELARRIAENAPLTNYSLMHALPRIAEQPADHGFLTEGLMSAIAQAAPEAKERVRAFLEGRASKVSRG